MTPIAQSSQQTTSSSAESPIDWAGVVPWLGAGVELLNALGNALPADFGLARWNWLFDVGQLGERSQELRRLQCLAFAGYSAGQIVQILKSEGSTLSEDTIAERVQILQDMVRRGERSQAEQIANCVAMQARFGQRLISAEELQGGTNIVAGDWQYPSGSPITPNVPSSAPSQTARSQQTGGRSADLPSLIEAMLLIWQNLQAWKQRKQQTGWQLDISLPSIPSLPTPATAPAGAASDGGTDNMAFVNTSLLTGEGGWSGVLNQALRTAQAIWAPTAMPGGASLAQGYTPGAGLAYASQLDLPGIDIISQGTGTCLTNMTSPFSSGSSRGARAKTHVQCDPITGRPVWFKPAGRPILWSGDLSACKRVRKVASRARRARGGR